MPEFEPPAFPEPIVPADFKIDDALADKGRGLYVGQCLMCHGAGAVSGGAAPDLRASPILLETRLTEAPEPRAYGRRGHQPVALVEYGGAVVVLQPAAEVHHDHHRELQLRGLSRDALPAVSRRHRDRGEVERHDRCDRAPHPLAGIEGLAGSWTRPTSPGTRAS